MPTKSNTANQIIDPNGISVTEDPFVPDPMASCQFQGNALKTRRRKQNLLLDSQAYRRAATAPLSCPLRVRVRHRSSSWNEATSENNTQEEALVSESRRAASLNERQCLTARWACGGPPEGFSWSGSKSALWSRGVRTNTRTLLVRAASQGPQRTSVSMRPVCL